MTKLEIFKHEVMKVRADLLQMKEENQKIINDGAETFSGATIEIIFGEAENKAILRAKLIESIAKGRIATDVIESIDKQLEQINEVLTEVTEEDI